MTGSRQFRLATVAALQSLSLSGKAVAVDSPGDWNDPPEALPKIYVRAGTMPEQKTPWNRGAPNFTTTSPIVVTGRVSAITAADCQDQLEGLHDLIEQAVLTNYALLAAMQQVPVSVEWDITGEGEYHLGRVSLTFMFEFPEVFEPAVTAPLEGVDIHVDTVAPFDPSGTYANPAFPGSVRPAPRTTGPDGRDEGALEINLPQ